MFDSEKQLGANTSKWGEDSAGKLASLPVLLPPPPQYYLLLRAASQSPRAGGGKSPCAPAIALRSSEALCPSGSLSESRPPEPPPCPVSPLPRPQIRDLQREALVRRAAQEAQKQTRQHQFLAEQVQLLCVNCMVAVGRGSDLRKVEGTHHVNVNPTFS